MKLKISAIICILTMCFSFSYAEVYTSNELISNAKQLDKQQVEFFGEAIGDIMLRGDRTKGWVNVSDQKNAIGIWADKELLENIKITGEYQQIGDNVRIKGIFNKACSEHGGDLDIHAIEIEIIEPGYVVKSKIDENLLLMFSVLMLPTSIMILAVILLKRRNS